jgi:hypothetical protein
MPVGKKKISGTDFEIHLKTTIRKNFPLQQGWNINEQLIIKDGYKPDFLVGKRKTYAVIDAKDKAILELRDIDQITNYQKKTKAKEAIIYIANDTEVPESVKCYADYDGVKIRRTLWRLH